MRGGKLTGEAKARFLSKMAAGRARAARAARRNPGRRKFGAGYARSRPGAQSFSQLDYSREAYRGYLIRKNALTNEMWIEKDGHLIHRVPSTESWAYARKQIDEVLGPRGNPRRRAPRRLPAKVERCVRAVKRRAGRKPVNPFAVCQAAVKNPARPHAGYVLIADRRGLELVYAAGKFTDNDSPAPVTFADVESARRERAELYKRYKVLGGWRVRPQPLEWWRRRKRRGKAPRPHR